MDSFMQEVWRIFRSRSDVRLVKKILSLGLIAPPPVGVTYYSNEGMLVGWSPKLEDEVYEKSKWLKRALYTISYLFLFGMLLVLVLSSCLFSALFCGMIFGLFWCFLLHPFVCMGTLIALFFLVFVEMVSYSNVMHNIIMTTINTIRGKNFNVIGGSHNMISSIILNYFVSKRHVEASFEYDEFFGTTNRVELDTNANNYHWFDIPEYQEFDSRLVKIQMKYLDWYEKGLWQKLTALVIALVSLKFCSFLFKTTTKVAQKVITCLMLLAVVIGTGMLTPFTIFAMIDWIHYGIQTFFYNCVKLYNYVRSIIKNSLIIFASGLPEINEDGKTIIFKLDGTIKLSSFVHLKFKLLRLRWAIAVLRFLLRSQFIVDRKTANEKKFKFRSVFTSFSLEVTRKINEFNVPGFVRKFPSHLNRLDVQSTIDILKDIGYPIGDVKAQRPNETILGGRHNSWLQDGTNFITGLRALKTYDFVEFNAFKLDVQEYRRSDSYVTIENELESVSRYFNNKSVSIPKEQQVVDAVWEVVKEIFSDSKITPIRSIYKKWKKNYNVGPLAPSSKLRKDGSMKKMRRTEDISRFPTLTSYLNYWNNLYRHFPAMAMISSAFYKSEALPEKKWRRNKVRTPIGSMLPQYLWQMVWSYEPNHRFKPNETPIQIGLPLTGFHLSKLFERHSKMKYHYAGDCTEFDSTITKNVQRIIKSVRKKGFSRHRQFDMISEMIDINYDRLNESLIMTPSTGNVYKKGTGLTTGHASTSSDNSLALVSLYMAAWVNLTGLSAHEFKNFNELSCYGDDNIFSIAEGAPKVWTFENICNVLATWGVTMNNEVPDVDPTDLTKLPFLSKFCKRSTVADQAYFREKMGMNAPQFIVYHNPDALLGKMKAPVLNRDPRYKVTRVLSYMDLCAHNEKAYYVGREVIETLLFKYPDLAFMRARIPSYDQVMEKFYSSNTSVRDPEERDFENFDPDDIVEYGSMTFMDYIFNYMSVVPDVLNPSIKNVGFGRTAQKALGFLTTWPRQLLSKSNGVFSEGHLSMLLQSSCYDFIEDRSLTIQDETDLTLLVRHWLFLYFRLDSEKYNPIAWIDWLLMKFANVQFILNGKIQTKYKNYSFPVWNLLLLGILNIVSIPDIEFIEHGTDLKFSVGESIMNFTLIDPTYWFGKIYNFVLNLIWDQVPPNFKNLQYLENIEHHGKTHLVVAGTGTGKSTTMILYLQSALGHMFKKIIVIEPRSKVVKGLVSYTKTIGVQSSGLTSGLKLDQREKVWYMTAQELLLNPQWVSKENLFVLDESHIDELPYQVVKQMIGAGSGLTTIMTTATPAQKEKDMAFTTTEIELPKIYSTKLKSYNKDVEVQVDRNNWCSRYLGIVTEIMSSYRTPEKFLIFINDKADLEVFSKNVKGKGLFLSSETEEVDLSEDCDFVVTTAVCDVAITIPGVTVVITPNFTRNVQHKPDGTTEPVFVQIDPSTLRQRMGRTGRTNNGDAYVINFKGSFISQSLTINNEGLLTEWLAGGLDINILGKYMPKLFDCFEKNLTTEQLLTLTKFIETNRVDKFKTKQRLKNPDEIPPREMNLFGIHMEGISGTSSGFSFIYSDLLNDYVTLLKNAKEFVSKTDWSKENLSLSKARFARDNFLSSIGSRGAEGSAKPVREEIYGTKRQFHLPETKPTGRPVRKGSF
ncbi:polyprotein [Sclerotinia sclerotiorum fusarivirus 1]|uniref:Polyprotein n=1 Tax=Sclerotinia sclerotiorum fusarivirus 1 TaxID=1661062 RepID=A0A0G3BAH4_9VIRU|nr:polyprotein [Sclerotinia sclerotiorum fusarivirus 1]AKJ26309.1 polyprotein [Sclerotinia sclerotiorum fusarivirus 1]